MSALPISQQRCFSARVGNRSTDSNGLLGFSKIEGPVLWVGMRLVHLSLHVPETGKYFLVIVALGYKWDTVL